MNYKLKAGAFPPTTAHSADAGYDLRTPIDFSVMPHSFTTVDTGVCLQIPEGYAGEVISKSGLNIKRNLTSTGLVDSGYTGSIVVKLYNHGPYTEEFVAGDKISQIMIVKILKPELTEVKELEDTERGSKGFGSSGR